MSRKPPHDPAFAAHDHAACIADAIAAAERRCAEAGLRLTPIRRRVLELLLREHRAMGAYDVLDRLREEGLGSQPPTAYRALDFLVAHGFAHRVERLNAFVACARPGLAHSPAFLICRACDQVAEADAGTVGDLLDGGPPGFAADSAVVEVAGLCRDCREGGG
ncbi:transcriptional repressor [Jannaschia sp. LMIT008]|uniref:transcriptional repressor n=1 Tax=Jannaschia maritima TaxID=3032585 RepID=UPI0028124E2B|nr:transcriptional repressor [Jannaschia sp. LMIT008]